ncbi:MAG: TIM barrel protein [Kiritimatiellia bacterium]|jgi:sugar phosphate isomerase/epimerase|nr:TIM barrel protein [Kiritimatiellia bacterium]
MRFALSTNWCALRHDSGEALAEEIRELGFDALELGYHTTEELSRGIERCVRDGRVTVDSVHAYCPVPVGAPHGYPELYLLASRDEDERAMASILLGRTREFAERMGARAVVLHAGRIFLKTLFGERGTRALLEARSEEGDAETGRSAALLAKALRLRTRRVRAVFDGFCLSLDRLLPAFEKAGMSLCLENLPSLEAFPDETEMVMLKRRFETSALAYWHDLGHGQVRENLGWIRHAEAARLLLPFTRGIHIHDVAPLMEDHLVPGQGRIDFGAFAFYGAEPVLKVFEPAAEAKGEALRDALARLRRMWSEPAVPEARG